MSKKDFIALADAIREANKQREIESKFPVFTNAAIIKLADFCQSQNPRFMRVRWMNYIAGECGKNGGKVKVAA